MVAQGSEAVLMGPWNAGRKDRVVSDQSAAARAIVEFDDARQRLYRVFGRVPAPKQLDGCPHCVDPGVRSSVA